MPTFTVSDVSIQLSYQANDAALKPPYRPDRVALDEATLALVGGEVDVDQAKTTLQNNASIDSMLGKTAVSDKMDEFIGYLDAQRDGTGSLEGAEARYIQTSGGGHQKVSWVMMRDDNGDLAPWSFSPTVNQHDFTAYVAVFMAVEEAAPGSGNNPE